MEFLVPNYSCLQIPCLWGYVPRSPFSLTSVLNSICLTPPRKKNPGYATGGVGLCRTCAESPLWRCTVDVVRLSDGVDGTESTGEHKPGQPATV